MKSNRIGWQVVALATMASCGTVSAEGHNLHPRREGDGIKILKNEAFLTKSNSAIVIDEEYLRKFNYEHVLIPIDSNIEIFSVNQGIVLRQHR